MSPDELDRRLDLFLDGDLSDEEMEAFRQQVLEDPGLRASIRDDLVVSAALDALGVDAFGEDSAAAPAGAVSSRPRLRWPAAAAAAAVIVLAFVLGRSVGDAGGTSDAASPVAALDAIAAGESFAGQQRTREVLVGDARLLLRPGARGRVVSTSPPALVLDAGSVALASASEARVEIDGFGTAVVEGDCSLFVAPATDRRGAYLMVTSFSGATRVMDGEFTDTVTVGEPRLFDGGGPRLTGDVLARLAEIEGDEGIMVLTSAEHADLLSSLDDDKERLQVKVAELMQERERLAVELEALKRRAPEVRLTLEELVRTTAELAEKEGLDGRDRARWWRRIRAVRRRAGHKTSEIVAVIDRELLRPELSRTRQQLGLWFLSQLRSPAAARALQRFTKNQSVALRVAATEGLARQKNPRLRRVLNDVFRTDSAVVVRIAAAGGLVTLGDYGEPLKWLLSQYGRRPRHPEGLRRRILARVMAAPLAESKASQYIVDLCLSDDASLHEQREVIHLLARLGSDDAEQTLAFLAGNASRRQIRALAKRRLDSIGGR